MNPYIAWLNRPDGATTARVGGKGARLARLGEAGFPVPPGFAVTVAAYQRFHEAYGLAEVMAPLMAVTGRPAPAQVREACAPLVERLTSAEMPANTRPPCSKPMGSSSRPPARARPSPCAPAA